MRPHHQRTVDRVVAHFQNDPTALAVVVAGSIAKGLEREDSDVDLMIVVTEEEYARRRQSKEYVLLSWDFHDYEGGYVDAKFVDVPFLEEAAERGSEPTRDSFRGTYAAWSKLPDLDGLLQRIPVYPEFEREEKIRTFYSQALIQTFFVGEAEKRDDPFLMAHATASMVLFGSRLLLAHNRVLFPSQKRLMERVEAVPEKPQDYLRLAHHLLKEPSPLSASDFMECLNGFHDWGIDWNQALGQYVEDSEFNWRGRRPPVADW
jgi:predicted nucleotidyltransferase